MCESSVLVQAEAEFVSAVIASEAAPGQMIRAILDRYREHGRERRSALAMALASALATRIAKVHGEAPATHRGGLGIRRESAAS